MDRTVLELAARINLALTRIDDALNRSSGAQNLAADNGEGVAGGNRKVASSASSLEARDATIERLEEDAAGLKSQLSQAENDLRKARMEVKSLMSICEKTNSEIAELKKSLKSKDDDYAAKIEAINSKRSAEIKQLDSILEAAKPFLEENSDA